MRKRILFQIIAIIAGFTIALLVIIELAISQSSTGLFIDAKKELLGRDIEAISKDLFSRGYVPELMDYCKEHPDEVSSDVMDDPAFKEAYKRVFPVLLERYGAEKYEDLDPREFPSFSPEEQAVYAHFWYYLQDDYIKMIQDYYSFPGVAVIDIGGRKPDSVFFGGTAEDELDRETLEYVITDENRRNGTLEKITKGEQAEAAFGIAYSGEKGNWFVGYYPLLPMTENSRYAVCIATDLKQFNRSLAGQLTNILVFAFVAIVVFAALLIWFLNKKAVRPVTQIQQSVRRYSDDKDTAAVVADMEKVRPGNEFGILAGDISHLAEEMERYNRENVSLVAEQGRINTEMNLAAQIQASMLPHIFPPFPERKEFDIFASMDPAKEVGGDFYDFFLVDSDHLGLVMADVSGKGVPAALFMMASKIILQSVAMLGRSPGEILTKTNEAICSNNQAEMFVTVWAGILEISTGKLTAANAGHEYPVLKRADGEFELFKDKHGFVIGGMEGIRYKEYEIQLNPGDKLFLYTDGIPEATDAGGELFGTERMIEALNRVKDSSPEQVLQGVRRAVDAFVKDAEQFDDLTMLCFQYRGGTEPGKNPLP